MNRPTDVGGLPRPPLALVGHRPEDGPGPRHPAAASPAEGSSERGTGARTGSSTPSRPQPGVVPPAPPEARLEAELRERTADLQRLKAEFDNYRRRVHRDRLAVGEIAVVNVLERLLPVLDVAAEVAGRGEASRGFQRVTEALAVELTALGLQSLGTVGEPFDPAVHEAVTYLPDDEVESATCTEVIRQGYRVGDRLLRPAQVAVTGPPPPSP